MNDVKTEKIATNNKTLSKVKAALVTLMWAVLWPILMFGLAIPIFSLASALSGQSKQLGIYLGTICLVLVGTCTLLIRLFRRNKNMHPIRAIGSRILSVYTVIGSSILIVAVFGLLNTVGQSTVQQDQNTEIVSTPIVPPLSRDASIDAILSTVGASADQISKFSTAYVNSYDTAGKQGEYKPYINATTGKFLYGKMTILSGVDANQTKADVAHEYLHHVWYAILDEPTKTKLTSDLITMYGNDSPARVRAKWYSDKQILQPTELFSIYCTESTDGYLTDYVRGECEKYINRNAFLMLR